LLTTGADDVERLGLPARVEIVKLPGLRKVANDQYVSRRLGIAVSEIRALRSELLLTTVKSFQPTVVLVDKHPFGASGEFRTGLQALRESGGLAALGLRDILDEPSRVLEEWRPYKMQKRIAEFYDQVLVYGQRSVFDPVRAYRFPSPVAERTRFCGYVVSRDKRETVADMNLPRLWNEHDERPIVLATAGGGEDGFFLLETFIRASVGAPWLGVVVAGPMTPEHQLGVLKNLASESGVTLREFVPRLGALFWSVNALVCMGGYNTLAEAVSKGVPTVCVPRVAPRSEQLLRATAFERLGLLSTIRPDKLNALKLRQQIGAALELSRQDLLARTEGVLAFDGARQAASHLLALATGARSGVPAVAAQIVS
jgi:predicted glycosyltransferase